jgi:NAD(P)-dependent dehydrogenase (short-subunit alcohol dehydrogenase family)
MQKLFDLSGRTAVVTGAGRGLGREFALALARSGADVAISDIDPDTAKKTSAELTETTGKRSLAIQANVSDPEQVDRLANKIITEWGHIDILVNNAGINIRKPIIELTPEEFDFVYNVNFKGVFLCSRRFSTNMMKQQYGKIINIASVASMTIFQGMKMSPYYVTKAAVVQFTKAAAAEWAENGIRVNAISPGWFITDINRHLWKDPEFARKKLEHTPMNRVGEPKDLLGTLIYLASEASDFVTGQNIPVDGGYTVM